MFKKGLSLILLLCVLFSGQALANHQGHDYYPIQNADHLLRHSADSDEIRVRTREVADNLREHHAWIKSRKPETHAL